MLVMFVIGIIIAHRTRFGTNIYALGGGTPTARLMGVPVGRTTIAIYADVRLPRRPLWDRLFALHIGRYSLAAVGVELDAIAAVVIGGHPADRWCWFPCRHAYRCPDPKV